MPDQLVSVAVPPALRARRRLVVSIRDHPSAGLQAGVLLVAVLVGLAISAALLVLAGVPAGDLADEFIGQTLLDGQNFRAVLAQAAPLILLGVSGSLAFRVNFWNLGLEGQMIMAAIAATAVSLFHVGPLETRLALMLVCGVVAAMGWAILPALLKLRLGVNEIISTLLLNYVAADFLQHLLFGAWIDTVDGFPHSAAYAPAERFPALGGASFALLLAVVVTLLAWWVVRRTRLGLYMRFVQANPRMALVAGVKVRATMLAAIMLSAAAAGLAGLAVAVGQEGRLTESFYVGYGFSGILIAFLARNNPPAALVVALLFATLFITGQSLQVFYQVPFAMVQVIQAIIVICVAASDFLIRHRVRLAGRG